MSTPPTLLPAEEVTLLAATCVQVLLDNAIPPGAVPPPMPGVSPAEALGIGRANVLMILMTHCVSGMVRQDGRAEARKRLEAMLRAVDRMPEPGRPQ